MAPQRYDYSFNSILGIEYDKVIPLVSTPILQISAIINIVKSP